MRRRDLNRTTYVWGERMESATKLERIGRREDDNHRGLKREAHQVGKDD